MSAMVTVKAMRCLGCGRESDGLHAMFFGIEVSVIPYPAELDAEDLRRDIADGCIECGGQMQVELAESVTPGAEG